MKSLSKDAKPDAVERTTRVNRKDKDIAHNGLVWHLDARFARRATCKRHLRRGSDDQMNIRDAVREHDDPSRQSKTRYKYS